MGTMESTNTTNNIEAQWVLYRGQGYCPSATWIERYVIPQSGNKISFAGKAQRVLIRKSAIVKVTCWFNSYGNPSYGYHLRNGDVLVAVSEFGGMNDLGHLQRQVVNTKKGL